MSVDWKETRFDILGGWNDNDNPCDIGVPASSKAIRMVQAQNVYQPGDRTDLMTAPGFAKRDSTTINAAGIFTGGIHLGELADEEVVTVSISGTSHNLYRNNANPAGAISGGTNFTIGQDNLVDSLLFKDGAGTSGAIFLSRLRDLPQFVNSSMTRSNFTIAGTGLTSLKPAIGEVMSQRCLYADVNRDSTVEDDFLYWTDLRDGNLITDYLTQRESVETGDKDKVRALRRLSEVCMVGKMNHIFLMAATEFSRKPFSLRELPLGFGRGPVSQQGTIATDSAIYWMGKHNIHRLRMDGQIEDLADHIRPTITSLAQAKIEFCVGGHLPSQNLVLWNVAPSGATNRTRTIAYNYKTNEFFFWTRTRNAYWNYYDSDVLKLSGGGLVGFFYEELSGTTGNADDATAAIDADIITPRHRFPGVSLIAGIKIRFDQQGTSEAVTVQYRLDDASSWSDFAESPYTVAGTAGDLDEKFFPLMQAGKALQLRFRDANSGQQFRVQEYGFVWKPMTAGLTAIN